MMFKSKLATLTGALVLASSTFAMTEKPMACPSLVAIQGEGVTMASEILGDLYLTYNTSNYGTPNDWYFIMGPVSAQSEANALEKANKVLKTMSSIPFPQSDEDGNWVCEYPTGSQDLEAIAVHPQGTMSPIKMRQFIQHSH